MSSGRSTPSMGHNSARHSRNLSQLEQLKRVQVNGAGARSHDNVFASLRATSLVNSKPLLPAELIATILDYLPVSDLMRFARVSRRLQEMVYDDTRWVQKLKQMGAWNEAEARQRVEDAMKRKTEAQLAKHADESRRTGVNQPGGANEVAGGGRGHAGSTTLFDAGREESKQRASQEAQRSAQQRRRGTLSAGFEDLSLNGNSASPTRTHKGAPLDTSAALAVFKRVRSMRGCARQEFGKVYSALGPIFFDLAQSRGHSDAMIFRAYRDPEQQAQILSNLKRFAKADKSPGREQREQRLDSMIGVFENAVLREFEQGYEADDIHGRMHRYAHVLVALNGGTSAVDAFISKHPMMARTTRMGNPLDCLQDVACGHVDLNPSQRAFENLAGIMVQQAQIIDSVFPETVDVLTPFWSRLCEDVAGDYLTALFDEAHKQGIETYVKAVAGAFGQALRLVASLKPTRASPSDFSENAKQTIVQCFDKHFDLYLAEEFEVFRTKAQSEVEQWEKELSEQEASTESFFMSNINRQAAKRDFLSSFRKVVMMPVNALPAFPMSSPFASTKPTTAAIKSSVAAEASRPATPSLSRTTTPPPRAVTPQQEPPTTELAAKAAIMNSRLEGIKSLFSIEVALNLTHYAKASIERTALMMQMGGTSGEEAKNTCERIFVTMLDILGNRHIRNGFDKALGHLSTYKPREVRKFKEHAQNGNAAPAGAHVGVEPLVTFLELVNVGDLIQQMIDVFYSQELVATKLTDRDDFLDPAVKEKKKFEQMLDERVAAGLNKGIDVLMEEVEYLCATTQLPTDFNPGKDVVVHDIGASATAKQIVDMVSGHTGMLVGSTDKNMLDVFNQEVGLRLFGVLCKHFKRQRISVDGAIKLISDINHYSTFIGTLRQKTLAPYYEALREMAQIYLVYIDPPATMFGSSSAAAGKRGSLLGGRPSSTAKQAKELATIIADSQRYHGIFPAEEVYEFAERRADWYLVKADVERAMYGVGCVVM